MSSQPLKSLKGHFMTIFRYPPFRLHNDGKTPSLKMLSAKLLGVKVQGGEHSSVQDAQAAMKLYMMHKRQWEKDLKSGKVSQAT